MENKTKVQFQDWAANHDWIKIQEGKTPDGYAQETYVTPAGNLLFAIFDNEDNLKNIAIPMPPIPMPGPRRMPGLDLPGLGFPPIGRG